jgi:hypothetical protein
MAKTLLNHRVMSFTDFGGSPFYMVISTEDLNSASIKPAIVPLNLGDSIQLRVTWEVYVLFHKVYVDVMTGEIVFDICMLIS